MKCKAESTQLFHVSRRPVSSAWNYRADTCEEIKGGGRKI